MVDEDDELTSDDEGEETPPEVDEECELCGDDHETIACDTGVCGRCGEILDNCDCESPEEIDATEWLRRKIK